jgi:hypothetical protein
VSRAAKKFFFAADFLIARKISAPYLRPHFSGGVRLARVRIAETPRPRLRDSTEGTG